MSTIDGYDELVSQMDYSSLESKSRSLASYYAYHGELDSYCAQFHSLLTYLSSLQSYLSDLRTHHDLVNSKTNSVRTECSSLMLDQQNLLASADRFAAQFAYFDVAEHIAHQLKLSLEVNLDGEASAKSSTTSPILTQEFPTLLHKMDESIEYMKRNSDFADAAAYLQKFERLQGKHRSSFFFFLLRKCSH